MTDAQNRSPASALSKRGRLILQLAIGALLGGGVTFAVLSLLDGRISLLKDYQRLVGLSVGLMFALMALFVLLGTALPRPGSVLLNVEDADELRERSPDLRSGALTCGLIGAILLTLSLTATSDAPGLLSNAVGTIILVLGLVALTVASYAMRNMGDELDKRLSTDASALAMHASTTLFGGWGILSYLGHAPWIGPLGLLAGLTGMYLAAIMWVAGRRGLLTR